VYFNSRDEINERNLEGTRITSIRDVNMNTKSSHFRNLGVKGIIILKRS